MRRRYLVLIVFVVINLFLTSCDIIRSEGDEGPANNDPDFYYNDDKEDVLDTGPVRGGVLKLFSTAPDTLNPILTKNSYIRDYSSFVYESLVTLDKTQKAVPLLAESWEVSDDGLEWFFHLRDNIFWHDNIPLSAEDVEFTISTILNNMADSSYSASVKNIAAFSTIDSSTFKLTLKSKNSFTPELMTFPIIPKHYFLGEDIKTSSKNFSPIGTGPFKFSQYKENEFITFISNEKWWGNKAEEESNQLPYIVEVNIRIYDRDKSIANAFQSKEVDIITLDREGWKRYSDRSDITIKKYPGRNFEFIAYNLSNRVLGQSEVRKAIAYTVDKVQIINDVMPGEAIASDIPVVPDTWLYDTNILSYNVDLQKARQLLSEAGWSDVNGTLYKRINGVNTPLKLELLVNDDNSTRIEVAEKIKSQLKEVGIEINIKQLKWEDEFKKINSGKYDMAFVGCTITSIPDVSFLYSSLQIGTGFNISGYKNEDVDRHLDNILSEDDDARKKATFINMRQIISDDNPYLGMYFYKDAVIYNKRVRGEFDPSIWNRYFDFTRWYIPLV